MSYESQSPRLSRDVLKVLLELYKVQHSKVHKTAIDAKFFDDRGDVMLAQITEAENALRDFQQENKISSIEDQKRTLLEQISQLHAGHPSFAGINELEATIESSEALIVELTRILQEKPEIIELSRTEGLHNYALDTLRPRLLELQMKESDVLSRYTDKHRALRELREQIAVAEEMINSQEPTHTSIQTGLDENYQALALILDKTKSHMKADIASRKALMKTASKHQAELDKLARAEFDVTRQNRAIELMVEDYKEYRANALRSEISSALDEQNISNIRVIQEASLPLKPVRPNKLLNIALGILLGLFFSVGLAFLMDYFDHSMKSNTDIESKMGIPVLITVNDNEC